MTQTKVISAFPGTGKTYFKENSSLTINDSDSSNFSWMYTEGGKVRNPEFPANYIKHIKKQMGTVDYILVSTHKEVRDALKEAGITFTIVYPSIFAKEEYLERYKQRGSLKSLVDVVEKNWDNWIQELDEEDNTLLLQEEQYLSDVIEYIS